MRYSISAFIIMGVLAILVGAAVWPAVGDAPWEKSPDYKASAPTPIPVPELRATPASNAAWCSTLRFINDKLGRDPDFETSPGDCPDTDPAERMALAKRRAEEILKGIPAEAHEALRPSIVVYFLATTPEERERAKSEMTVTALLWASANRSVTWPSASASSMSDWEFRQLEYEVDRLRRCVNFDLYC